MAARGRDIIVIGASAGGVEALREIVRGLPADLPAAVFAVLHVPPHAISILPELLARAGKLPASHPEPGTRGTPFERGRIYVAAPDRHMVLDDGRVRSVISAKENRHRPAVDPLFRSAARHHGPHVVGVILTGSLDDGTAGLAFVARQGGVTVVQDPQEALFPSMPRSAIDHVDVDHCVSLGEMPALLLRLAKEPPNAPPAEVPGALDLETRITLMTMPDPEDTQKLGRTSMFTCPECHGTLWEIDDDTVFRFRCHVGHALTADALAADQGDQLEATLWAAVRAFEERAYLSARMAERAQGDNREDRRLVFTERAELARRQAGQVRQLLTREPSAGRGDTEARRRRTRAEAPAKG